MAERAHTAAGALLVLMLQQYDDALREVATHVCQGEERTIQVLAGNFYALLGGAWRMFERTPVAWGQGLASLTTTQRRMHVAAGPCVQSEGVALTCLQQD